MPAKLHWWLVAALIIVKTILVGWWPFLVNMQDPRGAALYLQQAASLLDGRWLGPYTDLTLATDPVTAIWLATLYVIGVPVLLAQHALYIGVSILCMLMFARLTPSRGFQLLAFALVLFNPFSYHYEPVAAAFSEPLQQSFVLGILSVSIILFVDVAKHRRANAGHCILLGVFLFAFWNNGEHRLWLAPFLCWLMLLVIITLWKHGSHPSNAAALLTRVFLIPGVLWLAGTTAIAWKNHTEYGVFAVFESHTPQFQSAFAGIIGIEPEQWDPIVAAPPDVVDKLLSLPGGGELVSEFGELPFRAPIASSSLPWRLRKAVFSAGYYEKGGAAVLGYYQRLAEEIETACAGGTFACRRAFLGTFPPWRSEYAGMLFPAFGDVLHAVMKIAPERGMEDYFSEGAAAEILHISKLVNAPIRGDEFQEYFLPEFYKQITEDKSRYLDNLKSAYRTIVPALFWIALLGLGSRLYFLVKTGQPVLIDKVYVGLAVTMLVQMALFTLLRVTGYSTSPHLYFMFYPVFYMFILTGLLSVTRDILQTHRP